MVKHTQRNCLSVVEHFVWLALKGLTESILGQKANQPPSQPLVPTGLQLNMTKIRLCHRCFSGAFLSVFVVLVDFLPLDILK